jgi:GNAT superfamily N-acetyltransferase
VSTASFDVTALSDPAELLATAGSFLDSQPTRHHVLLTVIADRVGSAVPGRYWVVRDGETIVGVAMQTPLEWRVGMTPMPVGAARALAAHMADTGTAVPGVEGEAEAAAAFAGTWSDLSGMAAQPERATRIRELGTLSLPAGVPGQLRSPLSADTPTMVAFLDAFALGMGEPGLTEEQVVQRAEAGRLAVWDVDGAVVSLVGRTDAVAGVVRIAPVYTPPAQRNHGYAAACVGALSAQMLAGGHRCILYADLANPTSNGVYRRLGYEAIAEVLRYEFAVSSANALP